MSSVGGLQVDIDASLGNLQASMNKVKQLISETSVSVDKSTSQISQSFKRTTGEIVAAGTAVSLALGAISTKIVSEFKDVVGVYNKTQSANIGLKSIVDGQGRSFSDAQGFMQSYVRDGLVPLTNASQAYKLLTSRGYDTEQVQNMMLAFKDFASFNRQAALTMGEAIQGAAEGFKNENSVLTDNMGLTTNLSVMWEKYAKKIGVGAMSLSLAQKREAEYNTVMKESATVLGDAAKYANTLAGQMAKLQARVLDIQNIFGNTLAPVLGKVVKTLNSLADAFLKLSPVVQGAIAGATIGIGVAIVAVSGLTIAMTGLAIIAGAIGVELLPLTGIILAVVAACGLLGGILGAVSGYWQKMKDAISKNADSAKKATDTQKKLKDALKESGKGAQDNIQSFDELHTIQESMSDSGDGLGDAISKLTDITLPDLPDIFGNLSNKLQRAWDDFINKANTGILVPVTFFLPGPPPNIPPPNIAAVTQAISFVQQQVESLSSGAVTSLQNFSSWLSSVWQNEIYTPLVNTGALFDIVFRESIMNSVGMASLGMIDFTSNLLDNALIMSDTNSLISSSFAVTFGTVNSILNTSAMAIQGWTATTKDNLDRWASGTKQGMLDWASSNLSVLSQFATGGVQSIVDFSKNSWNALSQFLSGTANSVYDWARSTLSSFISWARQALQTAKQLATSVGSSVSGEITSSVDGIKNTFKGIGDWVSDNKGWLIPVGLTAGAVAAIIATGGLAAIPEAAAALGIGATKMAQAVPAFASGGITSGPTLAMVGDNPGGREAIIPLNSEAMNQIGGAIAMAMQFNQQSRTPANLNAVLQIDGTTIGKVILPYIESEQQRKGQSVIIQGV